MSNYIIDKAMKQASAEIERILLWEWAFFLPDFLTDPKKCLLCRSF